MRGDLALVVVEEVQQKVVEVLPVFHMRGVAIAGKNLQARIRYQFLCPEGMIHRVVGIASVPDQQGGNFEF